MTFHSILFQSNEDSIENEELQAPEFFVDLNLNQIVDTITVDWHEYNLKPFFYRTLKSVDSIIYRYEVMKDLERNNLLMYIKSFSAKMISMREYLLHSDKLYYKSQKERWFLDAVEIYYEAIKELTYNLANLDLKSSGFLGFRDYITSYSNSEQFITLIEETKKLKEDLSKVKYTILIKGNSIKVQKYELEIDYSSEVLEVFDKFKQGDVKEHQFQFYNDLSMNHVEAGVLDIIKQLYPEVFSNLSNYYIKNSSYLDEIISKFDREIQFYVSYLHYISILRKAGLKFCYAEVSDTAKEIASIDGFDLALAYKLISENSEVVCNDFYLKDKERIIIVTGPNQGGKTTFARAFGQMHYLSSIGCLVPGREAKLFKFDKLFTHFEKEENIKNQSGKLQDDLIRINDILKASTPNSIIIMNEIFNSTALEDAIFLGKSIMENIMSKDLLCVCVTFIDELAALGEKIISMVSTVVPENTSLRTYKIVRKHSDGLSFAISIAEKYKLTYKCIKERIK